MARTRITRHSLGDGVAEVNINENGSLSLTVDLSSTRAILASSFIALDGLDSYKWDEVYSTVQANSADWQDVANDIASTIVALNSANWISAYTSVSANSADWNQAYSTVNAYSAEWFDIAADTATAIVQANSANWISAYTSVSANSANWEGTYITVNDLSGDWQKTYNTVTGLSSRWESAYNDVEAGKADWDTTYSTVNNLSGDWEQGYHTLDNLSGDWQNNFNLVNGLSTNWQSTYGIVDALSSGWQNAANATGTYVPLSGGIMTGILYAPTLSTDKLEALSANITVVDIKQYELSGYVVNGNFTVNGVLSSNGNIIGSNINDIDWDSVYGIVDALSSDWQSTFTTVLANSAQWATDLQDDEQVSLKVRASSANWDSTFTTVNDLSTNWQTTSTTVRANSANWQNNFNLVNGLSSRWQNNFNLVNGLSSRWQNNFNLVNGLSSRWQNNFNLVNGLSTNWQTTSTTVRANSANWDNVYNLTRGLSSNWENTHTTVLSNSSNWQSVYGIVDTLSSNWESAYSDVEAGKADWDTTYSTVNAYSAEWFNVDNDTATTIVRANSANWINTHTTVNSNSSNWTEAYTTLQNVTGGFVPYEGATTNLDMGSNDVIAAAFRDDSFGGPPDFNFSSDSYCDTMEVNNISGFAFRDLLTNAPSITYGHFAREPLNAERIWLFRDRSGTVAFVDELSGLNTVRNLSGEWDAAYNTLNNLSAGWESTKNTVNDLSGDWQKTYNTVTGLSSRWESAYNDVEAGKADWDTTYSTVNAYSAEWFNIDNDTATTIVRANSANWNNTYTTVDTFSADWESTHDRVNTLSANWNSAYTDTSNATNDGDANPDQILKTNSSGLVGVRNLYVQESLTVGLDQSFNATDGSITIFSSNLNYGQIRPPTVGFSGGGTETYRLPYTQTSKVLAVVDSISGNIVMNDIGAGNNSSDWDEVYSTVQNTSGDFVPYNGATADVNLASNNLSANTAYFADSLNVGTNLSANHVHALSSVKIGGTWSSIDANDALALPDGKDLRLQVGSSIEWGSGHGIITAGGINDTMILGNTFNDTLVLNSAGDTIALNTLSANGGAVVGGNLDVFGTSRFRNDVDVTGDGEFSGTLSAGLFVDGGSGFDSDDWNSVYSTVQANSANWDNRNLISNYYTPQALTSASTISWNFDNGVQSTLTLSHSATVNVSNVDDGQSGSISGTMGGPLYSLSLSSATLTIRVMSGDLNDVYALSTNDLFEVAVKRSGTDLRVWVTTLEI